MRIKITIHLNQPSPFCYTADSKGGCFILRRSISLLGTAFGSIAGILAANRLVIYRIEQLEEKVAKHNIIKNSVQFGL